MSEIRALVGAEWLKLTRRPLTRGLLAVFLGLLALQSTVYALAVVADRAGLIGLGGAFGPAQLEEYRRRASFPGVVGAVFQHVNGLGGVFAVILAGAAMGSEYDWGTLRTQLCRMPDRAALLLAKIVTLLLLLLAGTLLALGFGLGLGIVLGAMVGGAGAPDAATIAAIPLALVRALFVLLPYVLLAVCLATARRSMLAGVAGGLVYLVFEAGFGALAIFAALGEPWRTLYGLTIGQNISALTVMNGRVFGLHPEVLAEGVRAAVPPPAGQAMIVVAAYCVVFLTVALKCVRRDVADGG